MDKLTNQINEIKAQVPKLDQVTSYIGDLKHHLPQEVEAYLERIGAVNKDDIFSEFKQVKVTPVTITVALVSVTTIFVLGRVIFGSKSANSGPTKAKKTRKKVSKAQKTNKAIQDVLDTFETKWVPQINDYFANYKNLKPEEVDYKYTYFQESLLKELFALDGIDTLGNEIIRENRKKVIQFIQDHQKRLDSFKKEIS